MVGIAGLPAGDAVASLPSGFHKTRDVSAPTKSQEAAGGAACHRCYRLYRLSGRLLPLHHPADQPARIRVPKVRDIWISSALKAEGKRTPATFAS